jgi:hypothetical protein
MPSTLLVKRRRKECRLQTRFIRREAPYLQSGFEKVERESIDAFIPGVQLALNSQIGCDLHGVFATHD